MSAPTFPLSYHFHAPGERRDITLDRTGVRMRRRLETRMTMTMSLGLDAYLGVARRGGEGAVTVLVHADPRLCLPLPDMAGVAATRQAEAWARELGLPCLAGPRRPAPRRRGSPLPGRRGQRRARPGAAP